MHQNVFLWKQEVVIWQHLILKESVVGKVERYLGPKTFYYYSITLPDTVPNLINMGSAGYALVSTPEVENTLKKASRCI